MRHSHVNVLGALALLLAAVGCASVDTSPPTPVTTMGQIAGKWQGTIVLGGGGQEFYYLTIQPDGAIVAQWGMNWQTGKVTLSGGTASFTLNPPDSTGTIRYYPGPNRRGLWLLPTFGDWNASVNPAP